MNHYTIRTNSCSRPEILWVPWLVLLFCNCLVSFVTFLHSSLGKLCEVNKEKKQTCVIIYILSATWVTLQQGIFEYGMSHSTFDNLHLTSHKLQLTTKSNNLLSGFLAGIIFWSWAFILGRSWATFAKMEEVTTGGKAWRCSYVPTKLKTNLW